MMSDEGQVDRVATIERKVNAARGCVCAPEREPVCMCVECGNDIEPACLKRGFIRCVECTSELARRAMYR